MVQPPDYYTLMAMQARSHSESKELEHRAALVREPWYLRMRARLAQLIARPTPDAAPSQVAGPRAGRGRALADTGDGAASTC
jgi:hypothetical protein